MKTIRHIIRTASFRWSLSALLFLAAQSPSWAHAFLDHADPKVGSTITNSPAQIKLWFTQNLEPVFSSVAVQNAQGKVVDKKDMHQDANDKSLLIISIPALPDGTYSVIWHVVSVDTHRTQGRFKFTINRKRS